MFSTIELDKLFSVEDIPVILSLITLSVWNNLYNKELFLSNELDKRTIDLSMFLSLGSSSFSFLNFKSKTRDSNLRYLEILLLFLRASTLNKLMRVLIFLVLEFNNADTFWRSDFNI